MSKIQFIIFSSDHFNTLGLLRSLGEQGYIPIVILLTDVLKPCLTNHSKYCKHLYCVKSMEEGLDLLLSKFVDKDNPAFILTGMDRIETFIDEHYDDLKDKFYFFNAGCKGRVTELMGKYKQEKLAASCGMNIIKSEVLKNGEMPSKLRYPILTKAVDSRTVGWKDMMHICNNEEELKEAYKKIEAEEILVQEFIEKDNEIEISGCSFNDGEIVVIPLQTSFFILPKDSYGSYAHVDKLLNQSIIQQIKNIFKKTGYNGIFEIEFLVGKDGITYFLEINFRASAYAYMFTKSGFQIPLVWAAGMLTGKVNDSYLNLSDKSTKAMISPSYFKNHVLTHDVGLFQWLKELKSCDVLFYYNKYDKMPFFYMIWDKIKLHILHLK